MLPEDQYREPSVVVEPVDPDDGALVDDIDAYVAQTDPEHLADAESELAEWSTPQEIARPVDAGDFSNVVSVFSAYSEVEANIIKGVLDAVGIPSAFDNHGGTVMGGIFSAGEQEWADIVVPDHYAEQARTAIAEARQDESSDRP